MSEIALTRLRVSKKRNKPLKLEEIDLQKSLRLTTGFGEIDRVLGGGLVPGQVVLLAGEPGIGKSTLLLQLAARFNPKEKAKDETGESGLYISGEESAEQIKLRASRLKIDSPALKLWPETDVDVIVDFMSGKNGFGLVIIDSIQTMMTSDLKSAAGTISQVRESAARLTTVAKEKQTPLILVGHITKEGAIAGPKILEHLVDTVLTLEGERYQHLRLLRANKNRFGPVDELGVFEMSGMGLVEVKNPSAVFWDENLLGKPGSAVSSILEGTRSILVEVEALVVPTSLPAPRRVGQGISSSRVALMAAVLQKQVGLRLNERDIFVKIAGGLHVSEPAVDLAVALAIASSFKNKSLPKKTVAIGEVGLLGEIRRVTRMDLREKEARRLGFKQIISAQNKDLRKVIREKLR